MTQGWVWLITGQPKTQPKTSTTESGVGLGTSEDVTTEEVRAVIGERRTGDAGDGFALVAEEIKPLAQESQTATDEIGDLLTDIQGHATDTAVELDQTAANVWSGIETVEGALDAIGPTFQDASEMRRLVRQVDIGKGHPRVVARGYLDRAGWV